MENQYEIYFHLKLMSEFNYLLPSIAFLRDNCVLLGTAAAHIMVRGFLTICRLGNIDFKALIPDGTCQLVPGNDDITRNKVF